MAITQLQDMTDAAHCRLLVVKVGSALLVGSDGAARREWLSGLVAELAALRRDGQQIIVVSSGAIALGAAALGLGKGGRGCLADAQAAAAVGQISLAGLWSGKFAGHGLQAAQLLLTLDDLEDRRRYLNASATLERLRAAGAVPVVNENDSVATEEIRFGDNDRLAARVAQAAGAGGVLLLSDVDGLYDRDPADPAAILQETVTGIDERVLAMAQGSSASGMGTGGMESKLLAASIAERAGIALGIINGTHHRPIARAMDARRGTLFVAVRSDGARKAWLGGKMALKGRLTVDKGCTAALRDGGSLLAAGITEVKGEFSRGDAVAIANDSGAIIAHGLAEYDAVDCVALKGRKSREHACVLGYAPRSSVIHRNHMVLL